MLDANRRGPLLADLAGDDVDHPAERIGAVEGGHRTADDFDPLDRRGRRHEAGGGFTEAVGGDVAGSILAAAVDEDQCVFAGHAADADVQSSGLAGVAVHVHAFDVLQCFGDAAEALFLQFFPSDHADARWRLGDLLFEAGGADNHAVQRDRRRLGHDAKAAAEQRGGKCGTGKGNEHANSYRCAVQFCGA